MQPMKACLYGGALCAAGIANAQSFIYLDTGTTAYGYISPSFSYVFAGYDTSVVVSDIAYAPDNLDLSVSGYGSTSFIERTSTSMHIESEWDGSEPTYLGNFGYAGGFIAQFFTVDQDATLEISWDLTGSDHWQSFIGTLANATEVHNFEIEDDNITGSITMDLVAGEEYLALLYLGVPFIEEANKAIYMNARLVPAPSTYGAGLLAFAGVASRRRRA